MAYSSYQNSDNINPYYAALVADTEDDIENLPTTALAPGSTCIVIGTDNGNSSLWILGNDFVWYNLTESGS